ncbi:flagellin N-terminal helical domain-containing protein [Algicola sagamiensis]|uniref:flagellin N-terminal helical domain-containing protein n=1 Tax=Algicola sagamiensis TaxID=163869 RepID=UPI00035D07BE|nr:flagellin [Algicola sagamiensis]
MTLFVNTNSSAMNAQRQLLTSGLALDQAFKRLSSGLRINSASDDAAGMQIGNRLTSQIQGLDQGIRNANDGISLSQTAEGALDEMTTMLQRMRTLAQQASNGSNTDTDRLSIQQEVHDLRSEINRIATDTTFGGQNLLNGSYNAAFQVGANANQTISFTLTAVTSNSGAQISVTGGFQLSGIAAAATALDNTATNASSYFKSTTTLSVSTAANAQSILANIDVLVAVVDRKRAELGAAQNRFQSTIRNQTNISANLSAARSRIMDADFATETAALTRAQVLQQASTSILAQANQRPQIALSLLG